MRFLKFYYTIVQTHVNNPSHMEERYYGPFYDPDDAQKWCDKFEAYALKANLLHVRARVTSIDPRDDSDLNYFGWRRVSKVIRDIRRGGRDLHIHIGGEG